MCEAHSSLRLRVGFKRLRKGLLNVSVDSAPLRHELTFMREALIEILNRRAGRKVVEEIVLE